MGPKKGGVNYAFVYSRPLCLSFEISQGGIRSQVAELSQRQEQKPTGSKIRESTFTMIAF